VFDRPFEDRVSYTKLVCERIAKHAGQPQLVFLDPDTGLAPAKPSLEHVLESEVAQIWRELSPGDVLAFYQHQTNRNGRPWLG